MKLFLCGDVMTGRGIDQILPHPCDPELHEGYVRSALDYVELAERTSGPIARPVAPDYIWGDALAEFKRRKPDLRIINLETAVTARGSPYPKGINYRMNPANTDCLSAAGVDCCVLANNHVLDWCDVGLRDTLAALAGAGIAFCGAGKDAQAAARPAMFDPVAARRVAVFAYGCETSGVPEPWRAGPERAGVNFLADADDAAFHRIADDIRVASHPEDLVVVSIHWGANWGYRVPESHRAFAHRLVSQAGVDVVHGHSSHHPMAIELIDGRPVFYGCGDFINDYEGISGREEFRPDLVGGYFLDIDAISRRLNSLEIVPFRLEKFRLARARGADADWLARRLDRECARFGGSITMSADDTLLLG